MITRIVLSMAALVYVGSAMIAAPQAADRPAPSMAEIEKWTSRELPPLGADVYVQTGGESSFTYKYEIDKATLSQCRLTLNTAVQMTYTTASSREPRTSTVLLMHLDADRLAALAAPSPTGVWKENKPNVSVVFRALLSVDEPFTIESEKLNERTDEVSLHVRDMESGERVVEMFRRAAVLCAGARPPTDAAEMTNAVVIKLVAAGLSEQVIANSIRNASTREFDLSPTNLIALKKAAVSDALIAVMQDAGSSTASGATFTSAKARKAKEAAAHAARVASAIGKFYRHGRPRDYVELHPDGTFQLHEGRKVYTGTYRVAGSTISFKSEGAAGEFLTSPTGKTSRFLAPGESTLISKIKATSPTIDDVNSATYWEKEPTATVPPKAADIGCSGVEAMGLYKNEIFDKAMGGGVVEWLAKIRNNTGSTRIVVFGWRDMYGQQQRAQAEIRGGDIATVRVDMTQARAIAPVADLRLLSCQ